MNKSREGRGSCKFYTLTNKTEVVGVDQNHLKNEVISVKLTKIKNYFMNYVIRDGPLENF